MANPRMGSPAVDWVETPSQHVFKVDVPGYKRFEIDVELVNDILRIIGAEKNLLSEFQLKSGTTCRMLERPQGGFFREFKLPNPSEVIPSEITARDDNDGILTIIIPKKIVYKIPVSKF